MPAILLALLLAILPVQTRAQQAGAAGDPAIVVGVLASLSGPGAQAGQDVLDGFYLALRHLGGRFANQEVRVEVADDGGTPDKAIQSGARLLERGRIDVVLTAISQSSLAAVIRPLVGARMFVLNLDTAPPALAGAECNPWLFDLAGQTDGLHEAAGQVFAAERYRRVVVIGPDTPQAAQAVLALRRTFPGEVAATITPRHGAATFDAEIAQLSELAPDAVYSLLTGGTSTAFIRGYHRAGLKAGMPLFGLWRAFERPMLPALGDGGIDIASISGWSPDIDLPVNRRMVVDFEAEHGRAATTWVAQGYDAALLLESALKVTGGRTHDSEALRQALRRAEFTSVRGPWRFNTNHFPLSNLYLRRTIRDSKGRLTNENRGLVLKDWHDRQAAACPMRWTIETAPPAKKAP